MKKILLSIVLILFCNSLYSQKYYSYYEKGDMGVRIFTRSVNLFGNTLDVYNGYGAQFRYCVSDTYENSISFQINGEFALAKDYVEFNAVGLAGLMIYGMMTKSKRDEREMLMNQYNISYEEARAMSPWSEGEQWAYIISLLAAAESASIGIPLGRSTEIEPYWSFLKFKRAKFFDDKFHVTGLVGLNLQMYFNQTFSFGMGGEYNWIYDKKITPKAFAGFGVVCNLAARF